MEKRYSAESMNECHKILYLRSRSSYRALRELLYLPCRNTINEYIGKLGLVGSLDEYNRMVKKSILKTLNEGQRKLFLFSFDEIHIKPVLHYQGKYILGNTLNQKSLVSRPHQCWGLMVKSIFGAPAFIGRLIPVS